MDRRRRTQVASEKVVVGRKDNGGEVAREQGDNVNAVHRDGCWDLVARGPPVSGQFDHLAIRNNDYEFMDPTADHVALAPVEVQRGKGSKVSEYRAALQFSIVEDERENPQRVLSTVLTRPSIVG